MDELDVWGNPKGTDEEKGLDKLPEIYRIPGESDEVGSWSELVEEAPQLDGSKYLSPDEIGDRKLDIMSGMDRLISYISSKMQNAYIYTRLVQTDASRFQAEFVAMSNVNGKGYTATYLTPGYALGMTSEQAVREGDTIIDGLARNLGQRIFIEVTPHIPTDAIVTYENTEKW
ncbi:MAG: hypothetical protein ACYSW6_09630 [Planctomycetota bacterium]|jgi:hypothetical protein